MMHTEHKLIAGILLGLMVLLFVPLGVYLVKKMLDPAPFDRFIRFPLTMTLVLLPVGIGLYYLHKFISDGHSDIRGVLVPILPLYAVCMAGWIFSYITRRRGSGI
jgi:putative effector of murein hydrolase LrgA (UPF0299 family)